MSLLRANAFKSLVYTRLAPKFVLEEERFKILEKIYTKSNQWIWSIKRIINRTQNFKVILASIVSIVCYYLDPPSLFHHSQFAYCGCSEISSAIEDESTRLPVLQSSWDIKKYSNWQLLSILHQQLNSFHICYLFVLWIEEIIWKNIFFFFEQLKRIRLIRTELQCIFSICSLIVFVETVISYVF